MRDVKGEDLSIPGHQYRPPDFGSGPLSPEDRAAKGNDHCFGEVRRVAPEHFAQWLAGNLEQAPDHSAETVTFDPATDGFAKAPRISRDDFAAMIAVEVARQPGNGIKIYLVGPERRTEEAPDVSEAR